MPKIGIVIGTVRRTRLADRVGRWVANTVSRDAEAELLDLVDYPMPFFDEPGSPRFNPRRTPTEQVQRWISAVDSCDGLVVVSPEYNATMPGVLKNAIDHIGIELEDKPVGIVTYGGKGGAQAMTSLRAALPMLGGVTTQRAVYFTHYDIGGILGLDGVLDDSLAGNPWGPHAQLDLMVDELLWATDALADRRRARRAAHATT